MRGVRFFGDGTRTARSSCRAILPASASSTPSTSSSRGWCGSGSDRLGWRQNLFAVTAASFIGFTGFTLVMPFLPLYLQQLGVTDVGEIALWSGCAWA